MPHSEHGFAVVENVLTSQKVELLRAEVARLMTEEGASCIRHVRAKSEILDHLAHSPELMALLPNGMRPVRSIIFDKNKKNNWPVAWHQDVTIALQKKVETPGFVAWSVKDDVAHVRPPRELLEQMWTLRIHLDDTDLSNGCLRVITGSHQLGILSSEAVQSIVSASEGQACECLAGDVLIMSPLTLHASGKAVVIDHRRVIHIEYARQDALPVDSSLEWFESSV